MCSNEHPAKPKINTNKQIILKERERERLRKERNSAGVGGRIRILREGNLESYPDFLEGFQQAQTVTKVTRRKMPPVDKMM